MNDDTSKNLDRLLEHGFAASKPNEQAYPTGRFEVTGEIARGGMGVVLRGLDSRLGRAVAIKVLSDRFKSDDSMRTRFVEEAQIGGQLQHPGVVPVYELGDAAGLPFFAMKLVDGRTLKDLLADRQSPHTDLRRFLGIFEQVCLTLAYAHARLVIHRDLKPSNIMVGAFGEVHVVDWGLAKVIGSVGRASAEETAVCTARTIAPGEGSSPGSVLGTPAYMPPEQASGNIEKVDARSDVFALGGILCEILTGSPPHRSRDTAEALRCAAAGDLRDAFSRLDGCGGDPDLIALARECLSPGPQSRPPNAGALADRIRSHLTSVEERAQAERLAALEEKARARAARKAQRLTAALSASVVFSVLLAAGTWRWLELERQQRRTRATTAVASAMSEAQRLHGEARSAGKNATEAWKEAARASRTAQVAAAAEDVDPQLRGEVETLAREVFAAEALAESSARRAEADRQLVDLLESIQAPADGPVEVEPDFQQDARRRAGAYLAAFHGAGIDLESPDAAATAALLRKSPIAVHLAAAVDDHALALRIAGGSGEGAWRRLIEIARDSDDDDGRRKMREAVLAGDIEGAVERLRHEYSRLDHRNLPAASFHVLGRLLYNLGAFDEGITIFQRGLELHPDSFPLAYTLGLSLEMTKPPRAAEAIRYLATARALRPSHSETLLRLALALDHTGQHGEAARLLEDASLSGPLSPALQMTLAMCNYKQGRLAEALQQVEAVVQQSPAETLALGLLGQINIAMNRPARAVEAYRKLLSLQEGSAMAHVNLGIALYELGQQDEGIRELERGRDLDPNIAGVHNNLGFTLEARGRLFEAVECYRQAATLDPRLPEPRFNLGRLLRSRGRYREALEMLEGAAALGKRDAGALATEVRSEVLELHKRLLVDQRGGGKVLTPAETLSLARLCLDQGLAVEAARYFQAAFQADPSLARDLDHLTLHGAVEAALRSGDAQWVPQARSWLELELEEWRKKAASGPAGTLPAVQRLLGGWLAEPALETVRDAPGLSRLPAEERQAWERLWNRLRDFCGTPGAPATTR